MERINRRNKNKQERDFEKVLKHLYNTIFTFSKDKTGRCLFTLSEGGIAQKNGDDDGIDSK